MDKLIILVVFYFMWTFIRNIITPKTDREQIIERIGNPSMVDGKRNSNFRIEGLVNNYWLEDNVQKQDAGVVNTYTDNYTDSYKDNYNEVSKEKKIKSVTTKSVTNDIYDLEENTTEQHSILEDFDQKFVLNGIIMSEILLAPKSRRR